MKKLIALIALAIGSVASAQRIQISGAGATFPYPIYSKWFAEYNRMHPNVEINYQSIGSGGGIRQLSAGNVLRRLRWADDQRSNLCGRISGPTPANGVRRRGSGL